MGVTDHAAGNTVEIAQQKVGGLSAHTGQGKQLLHGAGNFSSVLGDQHLAGQHDIPGLMLVKAAGMHQRFNMLDGRGCHGLQGGVGGKQRRSDEIHPCVRTLCRKPHGDHQLIILAVVQGALGVGVLGFENVNDSGNLFFHDITSCF